MFIFHPQLQQVPFTMHLLRILAAGCLVQSVFSFPFLNPSGGALDPIAIRSTLQAMSHHPDLLATVERIREEQQIQLEEWKAQGKVDLVSSLVNGNLGWDRHIERMDMRTNVTDGNVIIGPDGGPLVSELLNSFAENVEGLKKFPEDDHPFIAPGPTDQRGPCPGMNTLANHGYLPRNGIITVGQAFEACSQVFNMGVDLAAVLISGALAFNGDVQSLTFSLGGADRRTNSLGNLGGMLGTETGLDGHSRANEGDVSVTRCDFYMCEGDNHNIQPSLFSQLLKTSRSFTPPKSADQFNVLTMSTHFHKRYAASRSTNPNFYFVPPSALIVMGATYFYPGFFSNGTIGSGGVANLASIASFAGAHFEEDGSISYVPERIPEQGWYRRAIPMTLAEVLAGVLSIDTNAHNPPIEFGGNAGSTSKFVPGPGLLPENARDIDGLGCFLYNALYADFFGEFQNILFAAEGAVSSVLSILSPSLSNFAGCAPNFPDATHPNKYPNSSAPDTYGGALRYQSATNNLPGAPNKQPCLLRDAGFNEVECGTSTNKYDK